MAVGIVCELNPFHKGHAYLLEETRRLFPGEPIILAMSGCFVQRGEPALFDPYYRARCALMHGADMVILLPSPAATASAEGFARGALSLLKATNLVTSFVFGLPKDDSLSFLTEAARLTFSEEYNSVFQTLLSEKVPYAAARTEALEALLKKPFPKDPNALLALEYLRAVRTIPAPELTPFAISRRGPDTASALRRLAKEGLLTAELLPPLSKEGTISLPDFVFPDHLFPALRYLLAVMTPDSLARIDGAGEGLENRLLREILTASSYEELLQSLQTKRYPASRLRRYLLSVYLSITKEKRALYQKLSAPPFLWVLGARKEAASLLSSLTKASSAPVIIRAHDDAASLTGSSADFFYDELRSFSLYHSLTSPSKERSDSRTQSPLEIPYSQPFLWV